MPFNKRILTPIGFGKTYHNDIEYIVEIIEKGLAEKKFKILDKEQLLKDIFEYIYTTSDTYSLDV